MDIIGVFILLGMVVVFFALMGVTSSTLQSMEDRGAINHRRGNVDDN